MGQSSAIADTDDLLTEFITSDYPLPVDLKY